MTRALFSTADQLRRAFDGSFAVAPLPPPSESLDLLAIRVAGELFALPLSDLTGLDARRKIVGLPGDEPALLGIAGVQGRLVPVYSLAVLLGYDDSGEPRWMAIAGQNDPVGFAFAELDGHLRVSPSEFFTLGKDQGREHVRGAVRLGQEVRYVLDLESMAAAIRERKTGQGQT